MITGKSLSDALSAFASPDPTPGGGSAAAVASALGASLLLMVARLPRTRSKAAEERTALAVAAEALAAVRDGLTRAIDDDAAAYDAVSAAHRRPASNDGEKEARQAAIQAALRGATGVPLTVMRLSVRALELAASVAAHGSRAAASDVGVALQLLQAGLEGARLNVDVNLTAQADESFVTRAAAESGSLRARATELAAAAARLLG